MAGTASPIAIVGIACCYPDADSPSELFENVLANRRAFRRIPDERLPLDDYGSSDPTDVDATTLTQAALIEGYEFDRVRFKVVGSTYRAADLTHWLALDVADRALRDAGFEAGDGLPRDTTGVLLGNTLTGEFTRAQALRLRWPYVKALVDDSLKDLLPSDGDRVEFLDRLEARYKAPFEPFGDESLAGGLSNTIAGRICNYFDLHGGGYTVDGACSSALLAVNSACDSLASADLDVALAGGVDLSLDPFELVGFSRAGALATNEMRVYEERSEGFWPGEGCGFLVLMREADALAQGRHIHARIRGWGISSDGAGGISRPQENGQLLAMRRAYARAGFGPETVGYFEGHGTGTVVGDATELGALTRLLRESPGAMPQAEPVPIGSVKANIGHTKAAAGVAGLIKATLAVRQQIVPGMPDCQRPHERVDPTRGAALYVPPRATAWPSHRELRAGISSMGFGGINAHVVIDGSAVSRRPALSEREASLAITGQDAELFVVSAEDPAALHTRLTQLALLAVSLSRAEMADLAAALADLVGHSPVRAAIVASRPEELSARLETLIGWIEDESTTSTRISATRGIFLGRGVEKPSIGFLFPGQGAPVYGDLGALGTRFPELASGNAALEYAAEADASRHGPNQSAIVNTSIAQPAIVAASLASAEALSALGIDARVAVGHSLGEITALCWAGALSNKEGVDLAALRGQIISEYARPGGIMASLPVDLDHARVLVKQEECEVAGHNGPKRCVISGGEEAVEAVLARARDEGIRGVRLAVSHAFHSVDVAACAEPLRRSLALVPFKPVREKIVSTRTGATLERSADLSSHLVSQLTEPVRFAEALEKAAREVDLLIEVGPGRMLSGLAQEFVDAPTISMDTGHDSSRGLLVVAGAAWALGAPVEPRALFATRVTKPFDLDRVPRFFANPAAQPLSNLLEQPSPAISRKPRSESGGGDAAASALDLVTQLVADRCELPMDSVRAADRFLSDLHLTSIAVSTLASEAARELGRPPLVAPNEFADATVAELAAAIASDERVLASVVGVPGVDAWLRAFEVCNLPHARPRRAASIEARERPVAGFPWRIFSAGMDEFADRIGEALQREVAPGGVLLHLPKRGSDENLPLLLAATKAAIEAIDAQLFVLVHHGDAGVSVARTLHQEARSLATRVVQVPEDHPEAIDWVVAEAQAAASYLECRYDDVGQRSERRLRVLSIENDSRTPIPLDRDDVLLVSGGGKGIAAECALGLARETGCALGIIGRSSPDADEELSTNLERFAAAGIRTVYAAGDVADRAAVGSAIDEIEAELGPVTALMHGAGINSPASLIGLETADFALTLAPKLRGLDYLLERLEPNALRLVVGFGSVIAQLGLPGEADYAWANERMARRIEDFAERHQETRCLALEWSIWSGVGMGERLGRVDTLAAMNIAAISPDEGLRSLFGILRSPDLPIRIFLSGRFGSPPTLAVEHRELPIGRFLENVREYTPGVELVVDAELSNESDPYFSDHEYRGDAIFPGVLGLEAMAQIASALSDEDSPPVVDDVEFLQAIDLPRAAKRTIRIAGLLAAPGIVQLVVRSDASDFQVNHLRATLRFDDTEASEPLQESIPSAARSAPPLDPELELYGDLFFHSGRFQRVLAYRRLGSRECEVEIARKEERFFGAYQPQQLWLGDAGARDAAIHSIQACVPDRDLLPIAVERIETSRLVGSDPILLRARERSRSEGEYVYDLDLLDGDGRCLERWRGLRLREVSTAPIRTTWATGLLTSWLEEIARRHFGNVGMRAAVVRGIDRDASAQATAIAAGSACQLSHRPDGKPILDQGHVSISHAYEHTLSVVATTPVACDIEVVRENPVETWLDLLGPDRERLAGHVSRLRDESFDVSATRVWGAIESMKKLGVQHNAPIVVSPSADLAASPAIVLFDVGDLAIVSVVVEIAGIEDPIVISLLARGVDARV